MTALPADPDEGAARGRPEGGRGAGVAPLGRRRRLRGLGRRRQDDHVGARPTRSTGFPLPRPSRSSRSRSARPRRRRSRRSAKAKKAERRRRRTTRPKRSCASRARRRSRSRLTRAARRSPEGSFVLKGARVVTMKGDEVLENADVVVTGQPHRGGRAVRARSPSRPARGRLDAAGKTIIPGLIDTHAHLHYSGFEIFPETKWEYVANLAYGVTTVYDPSAPSLDVFAQAEMVEAGLMLGPRVYSSGDVLYGGQQADIFAEVNNQDDARRQVRRMKAYGARMIKVYQQPRREQRMWFAEACRERAHAADGGGRRRAADRPDDGARRLHRLRARAAGRAREDVRRSCSRAPAPTTRRRCSSPTAARGASCTSGRPRNPHDDPKLNRFVPHRMLDRSRAGAIRGSRPSEYHFPTVARGAAQVAARGRQRLARRARPAPGPGRPLGAVGDGRRGRTGTPRHGHDAASRRCAPRRSSRRTRSASRRTWARSRRASSPTWSCSTPIRSRTSRRRPSAKWVMKNGELYEAATLAGDLADASGRCRAFFWRTSEGTESKANE